MTPQRAVAIVRLSIRPTARVCPRKTRVVRKDASFSLTMIFWGQPKIPGHQNESHFLQSEDILLKAVHG